MLGGNSYQRIGGLVGGVSQSCVCNTTRRVVKTINRELKAEFLQFPDEAELQRNAAENFEKYHLANFGYAVDGVHMIFEEAPRGLPPGRNVREGLTEEVGIFQKKVGGSNPISNFLPLLLS